MKFPEKYIKHGEFHLHSGEISNIFYDVNELLTDEDEFFTCVLPAIVEFEEYDTYVGITTGGAIIASHFTPYAMIHDGELKGIVRGKYCLIDDVVTTEKSIKEAINTIGHYPEKIIVCVDRRKNKDMNIHSIYDIE